MQIPGYTILRKINSGGMASVYLAMQQSVGRTVALKIMKPELDQDPEFHQRFKREAEIIGQLTHPHIIPIYDIGRFNGLNFISMEYLPNGSLDQKIASGFSTEEVITVTTAIAKALDHAHSKGYVHRDIKPENILFRADNSAVLTDFGIAKTIQHTSTMTLAGHVIGTPYYMSPEQVRGKATDGRSDLYSLGVLLYEMLTGARPFQETDPLALALQHMNEAPPKLPAPYFDFHAIVEKLLAKKPEDRFQTARELVAALEKIQHNNNPLLVKNRRSINSFELLKAVGHTLVEDCSEISKKIAASLSGTQKNPVATTGSGAVSPDALSSNTAARAIQDAQTQITAHSLPPNTHSQPAPKKLTRAGWILLLVVLTALACGVLFYPEHKSKHQGFFAELRTFLHLQKPNNARYVELNISTKPESAKIRILNIPDTYVPNMQLPAGAYRIEVSAEGYQTKREWIRLAPDSEKFIFSLNKIQNEVRTGNSEKGTHSIPLMVLVDAGQFLMGDPSPQANSPQKNVYIDQRFFIGKYEVSFNEYDDFAIATNRSLPDDNGWGRGDLPVINVSWDDALAYTHWLSKITGKRYRLATDAEWEYAARGGTTSLYWWGNDKDDASERANCRKGCKSWWQTLMNNKTLPVGSFAPNDLGIHDTAGNVAEWVADCSDTINRADTNTNIRTAAESEPTTENEAEDARCRLRVVRGGSYRDNVKEIASHAKHSLAPNQPNAHTGFRVVKEVEVEYTPPPQPSTTEPEPQNIFQRFIQKIREQSNM